MLTERDDFMFWGKSWGDGHGGVRLAPRTPEHTPSIAAALTKRCIISLALGAEHGVAADNIGTVYTFGSSNSHLQLGTQVPWVDTSQPSTMLPIEVNGATSVRSVAAGNDHCISVTTEDEAYTWGSNIYGQLGLSHRRPVQRPCLARSFKEKDGKHKLVHTVHGACARV